MTVVRAEDAVAHEIHGTKFDSYVTSANAATLCAWQITVPAEQPGTPHRPDHDEVILILDGELKVTLNDTRTRVVTGEVLVVRAGDEVTVCGGPCDATAWVTTTPGLTATLADGTAMRPPWAQ